MIHVLLSCVSIIFWLLIVPLGIGLVFNFILPRHRRTTGITFILGFLIYLAIFEVIAIGCMINITYSAFTYCTVIYSVVSLALFAGGVIRGFLLLKNREKSYLTLFPGEEHPNVRDFLNPRKNPELFKLDYSTESKIYWGIFFIVMALQMVLSVVMASFDGDDAYYVVESLLAQQADVMNTILPYTGSSTSLDIRHALAAITMWIAFIARQSGVHATILSHSVMPLFFIPFVYLLYLEIGRLIFRNKQHILPVFMIIVSVIMMFGNVSIYTPATFFLMRTWQGKALVANLVFPMIFWVFLWMFEDHKDQKEGPLVVSSHKKYLSIATKRVGIAPWVVLAFINMFAGACSSMGVIFGSGLIALLTLVLLGYTRNFKVILGAFLCIIPNLLYLAIYFSLFFS